MTTGTARAYSLARAAGEGWGAGTWKALAWDAPGRRLRVLVWVAASALATALAAYAESWLAGAATAAAEASRADAFTTLVVQQAHRQAPWSLGSGVALMTGWRCLAGRGDAGQRPPNDR